MCPGCFLRIDIIFLSYDLAEYFYEEYYEDAYHYRLYGLAAAFFEKA